MIYHTKQPCFLQNNAYKKLLFLLPVKFFSSQLKPYYTRYEKATFFVLETSHINELRVTILAGNSYPYYQEKKKLVFTRFQNRKKQSFL